MSHDQFGKTTRRDFLGTATAATALTLGASPGSEAQAPPIKSDELQVAQLNDRSKRATNRNQYTGLDKTGRNGDPQGGIFQA